MISSYGYRVSWDDMESLHTRRKIKVTLRPLHHHHGDSDEEQDKNEDEGEYENENNGK